MWYPLPLTLWWLSELFCPLVSTLLTFGTLHYIVIAPARSQQQVCYVNVVLCFHYHHSHRAGNRRGPWSSLCYCLFIVYCELMVPVNWFELVFVDSGGPVRKRPALSLS